MAENLNLKTVNTVDTRPFKRLVMTIGELPTSFIESMTYYELLAWFVNYLETVIIPTVNNNAEATQELQVLFTELKNFVDNYFDNLNVQEEINNKLDEMAEDGTLQGFFTGYGLEIGEDNKVKVKAGSGITVDANGVSETPFEDFIPDLEVKEYNYTDANDNTNTVITYIVIPSTYKPFIAMADENDPDVRKHPSAFDFNYKPTVMINAGGWNRDTGDTYGPLIVNNEIKVENNLSGGTDTDRTILGIKEDGEVVSINGSTSADNVNAKYAVRTWYTVIDHGLDKTGSMTTEKEARTFFAQDVDGNYLVGVCGARTYNDAGLSKAQIADFLFYHVTGFSPKVAFCLDGGGSTCLMYKGIRQNPLVNNENRKCPNYIVFASETAKTNGVFEGQSVSNAKMLDMASDKSTAWFSMSTLQSLVGATGVTVTEGSRGRIVEGVLVCLNININIEGTLSGYSYLFENLPVYSGSHPIYFGITQLATTSDSDNKVCQVYLENATGRGGTIRNRWALPAGKYELNISYLTQP